MHLLWKLRKKLPQKTIKFIHDEEINNDLKNIISDFCEMVKDTYYLPKDILIYASSKQLVKALDGEEVVATCFFPDGIEEEIIIRSAVGDYEELIKEHGKINAIYSILITLAEQLSYVFCDVYYPRFARYKILNKVQDSIVRYYGRKKSYEYLEQIYADNETN